MKQNLVFIAQSLDGFIADRNNGLEWLEMVPNPNGLDLGYASFMQRVDALLMGRNTFDTICSFDIDWPYTKPVFVVSNSLSEIPEKYKGKIELVKGNLQAVLESIHAKGYESLYIDGGKTIQNLLKEDLIDEIIVTTIPILLGGGAALFGELPMEQKYDLMESKVLLNQIVQSTYKRKK
jgi:dihydrofolate reductase